MSGNNAAIRISDGLPIVSCISINYRTPEQLTRASNKLHGYVSITIKQHGRLKHKRADNRLF